MLGNPRVWHGLLADGGGPSEPRNQGFLYGPDQNAGLNVGLYYVATVCMLLWYDMVWYEMDHIV